MNTRIILAALVCSAASKCVQAEGGCASFVYEETLSIGGKEVDYVYDLAVDSDGSVVLVGSFNGTVDFDPGMGVDERTAVGNGDAFITKLAADGSYLWTQTLGGPGSNPPLGVAIGSDGSIVVTGDFGDTVDFDPTEAVDERTSNGSVDIFITKLNSDGSYAWTRTIGGIDADIGRSAAIDALGNIFVSGDFEGPVDFDPSANEDVHELGSGVFITAYTAQGEYRWTGSFGGDSPELCTGLGVDPDGDVLAAGYWGAGETPPGYTIDFDPTDGVDKRSAAGNADVWVSKWRGDGSYAWTRIIGGAASDHAADVAIDSAGNVIVVGTFNGDPHDDPSVDFDPTSGVDYHTSNGDGDFFITKLTGEGEYLWTRTSGGTDDDGAIEIGVGSDGDIFTIGWFGHYYSSEPGYLVDFDTDGCGDIQSSSGGADVFVTKHNANGDYGWTYTLGSDDWEHSNTIAFGLDGTIWAGGGFEATVDFDPSDNVDEHIPVGARDIYVTRLSCSVAGCAGDVNTDGGVDPLDLGFVLSRFGCIAEQGDPDCAAADANCDGLVDPLDSGYVLSRFGQCP